MRWNDTDEGVFSGPVGCLLLSVGSMLLAGVVTVLFNVLLR